MQSCGLFNLATVVMVTSYPCVYTLIGMPVDEEPFTVHHCPTVNHNHPSCSRYFQIDELAHKCILSLMLTLEPILILLNLID